MASKIDHAESVRAVRQLRRIRPVYAGGAVLWAASAGWTGWEDPGSRQMWVSVLFLLVFTGLLSVTSLWLGRQRLSRTSEPVHHAAPRRTAWRGHANA
ncbi:hypothetical protein QA862_26455 [Streptomyces sp. B21-101]|nr:MULTISPECIES: hypothetical protein [unclassified Streptomyces]KRD14479.1 hypothetical protein ASE41_26325 [Streptomyces sp. Root264]